jgi:predicted nucleotidyltransferase component of viral defense system
MERPNERWNLTGVEALMDKGFVDNVRLLIDTAPDVFHSNDFAMKGGTALNLFVVDMPRLSVDIDVAFVDRFADRDSALARIRDMLAIASERLGKRGLNVQVGRSNRGDDVKMVVSDGRNQIKVEVNHVFRGTLLAPQMRSLVPRARALFTAELILPMLAVPELYGSKLVAAMDRQHPRDFFDVMGMYEHAGLTTETVDCFVGYLAGHNRLIHEVLFPQDRDLVMAYENEFIGMASNDVPLKALSRFGKGSRAN